MTRQEIIDRVAEVIAHEVEGYAYYESQSPTGGILRLDYPVALDTDSVEKAAAAVADVIAPFFDGFRAQIRSLTIDDYDGPRSD